MKSSCRHRGTGQSPTPKSARWCLLFMTVPRLVGVPVVPHTFASLNAEVVRCARIAREQKRGFEILNVNAHAINLCFQDSLFFEILCSSHQVFCDGEGVRMVLRARGHAIPHRITYADWTPLLLGALCEQSLRFFVYGARPDVHSTALDRIRQEFPSLVVGGCHGYEAEDTVLSELVRFQPHVVLVCLGMPRQEHFIRRHRDIEPGVVWLSGGAALDYFSKKAGRAPLLMRNYGMEWLYRLATEPRRLFLRYVIGNPLFLWRAYRNIRPL